MSFSATVYRILIASPSDLFEDRVAIKNTINLWNTHHAEHYRLIFLPTMWETNTIPKVGGRPQEIINTQIVDKSDLLIGVFGTRIGSPTGVAESGTIEEIQKFIDSNKQASLYFSNKPLPPTELNIEQYQKLLEFKQKMFEQGLMGDFSSIDELERKIEHLLSEFAKEKGNEVETGDKAENFQAIRKPNFKILFNDMEHLELKKHSAFYNRERHEHIDYDEIDEDIQKYITRDEVDEYNRNIPDTERVEKYNTELRKYHLVKNHLSDLKISIENTGNLKANGILVDLTFPPEVLILEKGDSDTWEKPEIPNDFPINPLVKAQKQYNKELINMISPLASISVPNIPSYYRPYSASSTFRKFLSSTNSGHHSWVEDNEVTIKIDSLLHTRRRTIEDDIEIVALKNGEYTIDVEIISEELEEKICFTIPLIVTR